MKNILVLQNARIGDMLQATPMLRGLKETYHGCHVTMLVNRLFGELELEDGLVDEVVQFDQNGLYELLQNDTMNLVEKYDHIKGFVAQFQTRTYDLILNLPSDANNHLLSTLLSKHGGEVRGGVFTADRALVLKHPTMFLFYTMSEIREFNRFNLVDLLTLCAGVRPDERRLHMARTAEGEAFADRFLAAHSVGDGDFLVALQPGASEERKRWRPDRFAELADALKERMGARVIICGSSAELPLGQEVIRRAKHSVIDAVGKTSLSGLASLLSRCALLVTNDTGTMHMATAVGTRVIDLSTGPVYFRETGPYAEGSFVVQGDIDCFPCHFTAVCHHLSCRELITVPMVARLVELIKQGLPPSALNPRDFSTVRLYASRFNDVGRIEFLPVFRYALSDAEFMSFVYTHMWEVIHGLRRHPMAASDLLSEIGQYYDVSPATRLREYCASMLRPFRELSACLDEAIQRLQRVQQLCHHPTEAALAMSLCSEITAVLERVIILGRVHSVLKPLTIHLRLLIDSQEEGALHEVAAEYESAYRSIADQSLFMTRSLERLEEELAKPGCLTAATV
ncbi:MAG: glycosyltransferase family 9 protein [Acidobacteria bacterium]|nr:glycosyltransferase family 9 protein [Acidobacteriota bacterium]MBI3657197.1 glycosyltransferase family 9 protein [Acidobacteriota bacterium]